MAFLSEKCACAFNKVPTLNTEKVKDIVCDNWLCDSSDLVKDFGFKPEYNLRKGVAESISWYKENQWL
jgi:nucleoside-diphosphate-sugar epimerase